MPDTVHGQIVLLLARATRAVSLLYKPFLHPGLTVTQCMALLAIHETPGLTVTELGERLGFDSSTATPLVQKLIKLGAVEKRRSGADERVVQLYLTGEGLRLADLHCGLGDRVAASLGLSDADREQLSSMLRVIIDRTKRK